MFNNSFQYIIIANLHKVKISIKRSRINNETIKDALVFMGQDCPDHDSDKH